MYLLKRKPIAEEEISEEHLHSTMYLLKLFPRNILIRGFVDLHSTMYLLKLACLAALLEAPVSIYIPLCIY